MTGGSVTGPSSAPGLPEGREPGTGLTRMAVGGVAWQGLSYLLGRILVLATTVVLARLLTPGDFGLVALALVFIAYVEVATDLGVAQALIFLPADRRRNDVALAVSLLVSALLVTAAMLAAPAVARFFDRPDLTTMFRVLSISLLLGGAGQVPDALLRKSLRFRRRLLADLSRAFIQGSVSIALAAFGLGAWAIVWGYLAGGMAWLLVAWALVDYRPSPDIWRVTYGRARPLLAYGVPVAGNALLLSLVFDLDYLIVGKSLGTEALGLYTLAFRIPEMVIINVFYVLSAVAFPLFSLAREVPGRLRRGYLSVVRLQTVYGAAAGVGLAMVAPMLVPVVFGPRWEASIAPLQALALYAAFRSLGIGAVDVYKAMGRPGLAASLSFARLAVLAPALLIAVGSGIEAVAWTQAVVALVLALLMQAVACRVLGLPLSSLGAALVPAAAVALGTAAGAGAIRLWLPAPEWARLAAAVVAGGLAGILAVHAVDRRFLSDARSLLRRPARTEPVPS
jgi:lipopolysaccharide exporter